MAVAKPKSTIKIDELNVPIPIQFICPVCKTSKKLKIAKSVINQSGQLTTISIPRYKVCDHHFQAFVDKNCVVRGYQRVDFEFGDDKIEMLRNYGEGQDVEVAFNISSREFNGKYYHNIDAWKINPAGQAAQMAGGGAPAPAIDAAPAEEDHLPF